VLEKKDFSSQLGRCSAHSGLTGGTERATKGEFATVVAETTCCVLAFRAALAVIGDVEARPRAKKKASKSWRRRICETGPLSFCFRHDTGKK
jgi:hypothetical protein